MRWWRERAVQQTKAVASGQAADICLVGLAGLAAALAAVELSPLVTAGFVAWIVLVYGSPSRSSGSIRPSVQPLSRHGASVVGLTAVMATMDVVPEATVWGIIAAVLGGGVAALVIQTLRRVRRGALKVMVVGDASAVEDLLQRWTPSRGIDVVAACVPDKGAKRKTLKRFFGGPVIRSIDAVVQTVQTQGAELVVVAPGASVSPADVRRLGWMLEDLPVGLGIIGLPDTWAPHRLRPGRLGRHPVVEVSPSRSSWMLRVVKESLDRLGAAVLLVVAVPVLTLAAIAIRLDSRGAAFFTQRRVGIRGQEFTMFKLRTMCHDAENLRASLQQGCADQMLFKLERDPRITRVGRFLRRLSLDELPQLLNVVRGDMSLVGPRPALPEEVAKYDADARRRLVVKPGLTGLWQVSGRSDLSWEESISLDLHYVDNWRLSDDAVIAARTFRAVITSRGAY